MGLNLIGCPSHGLQFPEKPVHVKNLAGSVNALVSHFYCFH